MPGPSKYRAMNRLAKRLAGKRRIKNNLRFQKRAYKRANR